MDPKKCQFKDLKLEELDHQIKTKPRRQCYPNAMIGCLMHEHGFVARVSMKNTRGSSKLKTLFSENVNFLAKTNEHIKIFKQAISKIDLRIFMKNITQKNA